VRTAAFNGRYVLGANDPTLSDAQMLTLARRRDVPAKRFALLKGPEVGPKRSLLLLFRVAALVHSSVGLAHATVAGRGRLCCRHRGGRDLKLYRSLHGARWCYTTRRRCPGSGGA